METEKIIHEFPKALLNWYGLKENGAVLFISEKDSGIEELLRERCEHVRTVGIRPSLDEDSMAPYNGFFDYIVAVGVVEYISEPIKALSFWKTLLNPTGRLLLGMENRLGLRYFCGDRDPFTGRNFDGIENYRRVLPADRKYLKGRGYSQSEIREMLSSAGWEHKKFYAVLPDLNAPQLIYAEDFTPAEELSNRYFPMYHDPETVFLEEEFLYTDLIRNGIFHTLANSFLVECSMNSSFENVWQVTLSMDRGKENAAATILRSDRTVEKRFLYREGYGNLGRLKENEEELKSHGIHILEGEIRGGAYRMPLVDREMLTIYLRRLAGINPEGFIEAVDMFRDQILQSSEHAKEDDKSGFGVTLKYGFWDMVPLNCFYDGGKYLFFDQEFYEKNYPANAIIYRSIEIIYACDLKMEAVLPKKYFRERYGLEEKAELWQKYAYRCTEKLRHQRELQAFYEKVYRNPQVVNTNRQRMNYSTAEYRRIFVDLFRNADRKKIVLFGSGNFTKRFLAQFGREYPICAIVDNNRSKWGGELEGVLIKSPEFLKEIPQEERRVIICVKGYMGIVHQLAHMGISDYCIYDTNVEYPRRAPAIPAPADPGKGEPKKYHIGYIAGVFDLFHIGHLNMFRRAKEQCDYLIVGVVTDEGVKKHKETETFIPFLERIELVRSCRYVDEAVEIPVNYGGTRDAYKMYHFDCQFSGSDYIDHPAWLADKEYLEKQGAELVFFPYTEGTSSTQLKQLITKSLSR